MEKSVSLHMDTLKPLSLFRALWLGLWGNTMAGTDQPTTRTWWGGNHHGNSSADTENGLHLNSTIGPSRTNVPTLDGLQPPNTNNNIPMGINPFNLHLPGQLPTVRELQEEGCDESAVSLIRHFIELYPVNSLSSRNIEALATLTSLSNDTVRILMMTIEMGIRPHTSRSVLRSARLTSKSQSLRTPMNFSRPRMDHTDRSICSDLISQQGSRKGEDLEL